MPKVDKLRMHPKKQLLWLRTLRVLVCCALWWIMRNGWFYGCFRSALHVLSMRDAAAAARREAPSTGRDGLRAPTLSRPHAHSAELSLAMGQKALIWCAKTMCTELLLCSLSRASLCVWRRKEYWERFCWYVNLRNKLAWMCIPAILSSDSFWMWAF